MKKITVDVGPETDCVSYEISARRRPAVVEIDDGYMRTTMKHGEATALAHALLAAVNHVTAPVKRKATPKKGAKR